MTMDAVHAAPANECKPVKVRDVIREAAAEFEMTEAALLRRTRQRDFAQKRQVAMYLARELTPCSYPRIGAIFGAPTGAPFDHSTVHYAHKIIGERIARNARLAAQVARIRARLIA